MYTYRHTLSLHDALPIWSGGERNLLAIGHLQNVEAAVAVEHVDDAVLIHVDVVGLRARLAADRLRNEGADLLRREGIGDVDDAQPAGEPGGEDQRLVQLLAELMGAEAARRAGPGRVQLADVEGRERGDVLKIGDVEDPEEGVQIGRANV